MSVVRILRQSKDKYARSTALKIASGAILGASLVGGIATAVVAPVPAVKACVDNKTQAMFLATKGACTSKQSLVDLGTGTLNVKAIAAAVTPSV